MTSTWSSTASSGGRAPVGPCERPSVTSQARRRSVLAIALAAVLVAALGLALYQARDELARLAGLDVLTLTALLLLRMLAFALFSAASLVVLERVAPTLSWRELTVVSGAGALLGHLLPAGGGAAAKGIYLRQRHGLGYAAFVGAQTVLAILVLAASGAAAVLGLALLGLVADQTQPWFGALLALLLLGTPLPLLIARPLLHRLARGVRRLRPLVLVWGRLIGQPRRLLLIAGLLWVRALMTFAALGLTYRALDPGGAAFLVGGVLDALTSVLQVIRITPANLGLYEGSLSLLGQSYGTTLAVGILAAVVTRLSGVLAVACVSLLLLCEPRTRQALRTSVARRPRHDPRGAAPQASCIAPAQGAAIRPRAPEDVLASASAGVGGQAEWPETRETARSRAGEGCSRAMR